MASKPGETVNWDRYHALAGTESDFERRGGLGIEIARRLGSGDIDTKNPTHRRLIREVQRSIRGNPIFQPTLEKHGLELVTLIISEEMLRSRARDLTGLSVQDVPSESLRCFISVACQERLSSDRNGLIASMTALGKEDMDFIDHVRGMLKNLGLKVRKSDSN
jgi:hypothetical protein